MPAQALVTEKRYEGKYVALESFTSNRVLASGNNPSRLIAIAEKKGVADPVIVFIPCGDMTYIY